jgi:hypothetical protein
MVMTRFLRLVLLADAGATAVTGLLMAAASQSLEVWLNIPSPLLFYAGVFLLPYAAFVSYLAAQPRVPRAAVWVVIGCNALWAIDSILLLASGWIEPSTLGYAFVIAQAIVVGVFCELQLTGVRRTPAAAS